MLKVKPFLLISTALLCLFLIGCSRHSADPVTPGSPELDMPLVEPVTDQENHEMIAAWTATFDLASMTASIEPSREMAHFNVKPYLPAPVITVKSWDPAQQVANVDIKISNVYNIHAYDLRMIVFTDTTGHLLTNPDGWTSLYDIAGGLPFNPFKAYAKDTTNRLFAAYTQHTENLNVKLPGGNPYVKFAIDVSSPGNCEEPYEIANFTHDPIMENVGSSGNVSFTVSRWNPTTSVRAWIQCTDLGGAGTLEIPSTDNYHFKGQIANYLGAGPGEHAAVIMAKTSLSSIYLYDLVSIFITRDPGTGWVVPFADSAAQVVDTDSTGMIYTALYNTGRLKKFNNDEGLEIWSRQIGTEDSFSYFNDISVNDYVAVAGSNFFCTTNSGYTAGVYGTDNSKLWSKYDCLESARGSDGWSLIGDKSGNTYMASAYGSNADAYPGLIPTYSDSRLTKFDIDGNVIWNRDFIEDSANLIFYSLEFSETESIYATGYFMGSGSGTVDFDPTDGELLKSRTGYGDSFLAEYSKEGLPSKVVTWGTSTPGSMSMVLSTGVKTDSSGNIFVIGTFMGDVDFDPGTGSFIMSTDTSVGSVYVSKFDSDLNFVNAVTLNPPYNMAFRMEALDLNNNGDVYVTGTFQGTFDFDPGSGIEQRTSAGNTDFYLLKLSNDLGFNWVQTWGSTGVDYSYDVACDDSSGAVYMVGSYGGAIDFDPGPGVHQLNELDGMSFLMKALSNGYWE